MALALNLKHIYLYEKKVIAQPGSNIKPLVSLFSTLPTTLQGRSNNGSQNHYLSHAYGKAHVANYSRRDIGPILEHIGRISRPDIGTTSK